MKIAFFVTEFPSLTETFIANQIIAVKKSGHVIHIFAKQKPTHAIVHQMLLEANLKDFIWYLDDIPKKRIHRIFTLLLKISTNIFNKNTAAFIRSTFKNKANLSVYNFIPFIDKPDYDVLHAHFGVNGNYVTELRNLGLYKNAKFVTTFHGYDLHEKFANNKYYSDLFNSSDKFTVNSYYSKKLLEKLGCPEGKITILPVGVDVSNFEKKNQQAVDNAEIKLIFVGRLIRLKGPNLFVEICNLLLVKKLIKFSAVIIGDGSLHDEVNDLIKKYNLQQNVKLLGAQPQEKVIYYLQNADVFVLPGITNDGVAETQGLVIQEAQAMKLPVVISNAGGMAEGVKDGVTGFVLPQNDVEKFVDKIELLGRDGKLRKKMGEKGRKLVKLKYDIDILTQKLIKIYFER